MQINSGLRSSPHHQNLSKSRAKKKVIPVKNIAFNPEIAHKQQCNSLSPSEGRQPYCRPFEDKMQQLTSPQCTSTNPQQLLAENWTFLQSMLEGGEGQQERVEQEKSLSDQKRQAYEVRKFSDSITSSGQNCNIVFQKSNDRVDSSTQNQSKNFQETQIRKMSTLRQDQTPTTATSSQNYQAIISQGSMKTDIESIDPYSGKVQSKRKQYYSKATYHPQNSHAQSSVSSASYIQFQKSQGNSPDGRNEKQIMRLQKDEEQHELLESLNKQILEKRLKESQARVHEDYSQYASFTPFEGSRRQVESQGYIIANIPTQVCTDQGRNSKPTSKQQHLKQVMFKQSKVLDQRSLEVLEEETSVEQQSLCKVNSQLKASFGEEFQDCGIPNTKEKGTYSMKEQKMNLDLGLQESKDEQNLELQRLQSLVESLVEEQNSLKQKICEHEIKIQNSKEKINSGSLKTQCSEEKSVLASNTNTDRASDRGQRDSSREYRIRQGKKQSSCSSKKSNIIPEVIFDPNQKESLEDYGKDLLSKNIVLNHQINIKKINADQSEKAENQRYGKKQQRALFLERNEQKNVQNHLIKYGHSQSNTKPQKRKPQLDQNIDFDYQKVMRSYQTIDQIKEINPAHSNVARSIDTCQFQKGSTFQKGQLFPSFQDSKLGAITSLYQSAKFLPEIKNSKLCTDIYSPQTREQAPNLQSNFHQYEKNTQEPALNQGSSKKKKSMKNEIDNISSMMMPESMVVYQETFKPNQNNLFGFASPTSGAEDGGAYNGFTFSNTQGSKALAKINPVQSNNVPKKSNSNMSKMIADRITFSNFNKDGTYELVKMEQTGGSFRKASPYASSNQNSSHFSNVMVKRSQAKLQPLSNTNKKGMIPVGHKNFPRDFFHSNER